MRAREWVAAGLLLAACDNAETSTVEPSEAATPPAPAMLDGPPAALRRDLRTCEKDGPVGLGEIEYGVRVSPSGQAVLVKALRSTASPALLNCTLQRLRAWGFPATAEGAAFRFAMRFGHPDEPAKNARKSPIKGAIKHRTSALQHCYNAALREDSSERGQVDYVIEVATTGAVTRVEARATDDARLSAALVDCTKAKIERWTFPDAITDARTEVSFSVFFSG